MRIIETEKRNEYFFLYAANSVLLPQITNMEIKYR